MTFELYIFCIVNNILYCGNNVSFPAQGDLVQVTQDAMSLPRLQVTVIHRNQDEAAITGRALCSLVLDWIRKQMEEEELQLDSMKEKVRGCFS